MLVEDAWEGNTEKEKYIQELLKVYKTYKEEYVRLGAERDGGYVMVNDISKDDFLMSCGITDNINWKLDQINFENQMSELVKAIDMYECAVDYLENMPTNSKFFKARIGEDTGIKDLFNNAGTHQDYILKMDIEGSEWDFFDSAESSDIEKFRQIVIELHWLSNLQKDDEMSKKIESVLSKINKTHKLVLIHGNNHSPLFNYGKLIIPDVIEALYLRKGSYNFVDEDAEFFDHPENLNVPCASYLPEIDYYLG